MTPSSISSKFSASVATIRRFAVEGLIVLAVAYLALTGLDNTYFWDDEAYVGIMAKNFLATGTLTGWDGRNLWGYRNGSALNHELLNINPPLDNLITAAAFALSVPTTWTARFPFVMIGLLALLVLAVVLYYDFGQHPLLVRLALASTGLSVSYLLYIRQCRYYAPALLFALLVFYSYRRYLDTFQIRFFVGITLSAILLFYTNWLLCAGFLLTLGIFHLTFYLKKFSVKEWRVAGISVVTFAGCTVPYALYFQIWNRPDVPTEGQWILRGLTLMWWNVREMNGLGVLPWTLAVGLGFCLVRYRQQHPVVVHRACQWAFIGILNLFVIAWLSPQPLNVSAFADVRYILVSLPFLVGLVGIFLWFVAQKSLILALGLLAVVLTSNALAYPPINWNTRWLLPAYIAEIHNPYPDL